MDKLRSASIVITIIGVILLPLMLLALYLKLLGNDGPIQFDDGYYRFFSTVFRSLDYWEFFKIPEIPTIPIAEKVAGWRVITIIINFFNSIIKFLNIISTCINSVIYIIKFIIVLAVTFVKEIPNIVNPNGSDSAPYPLSWWYNRSS